MAMLGKPLKIPKPSGGGWMGGGGSSPQPYTGTVQNVPKPIKPAGNTPWLNNPMSYNGTQQKPLAGGLNPAWSDPPKPNALQPVPQAPAPMPVPPAPAGAQLGAPIAPAGGQQQPWMQNAVSYSQPYQGTWNPYPGTQAQYGVPGAGQALNQSLKDWKAQMLRWDTTAPPLNDKHISIQYSPLSEAYANAQRPGEPMQISVGEGTQDVGWPGYGGSLDDYANDYYHNKGPYQQRIVMGPDGVPYVRSYELAPTDDFLGSLGAGFGFGGLFGPIVAPGMSSVIGSGMSGASGTGP